MYRIGKHLNFTDKQFNIIHTVLYLQQYYVRPHVRRPCLENSSRYSESRVFTICSGSFCGLRVVCHQQKTVSSGEGLGCRFLDLGDVTQIGIMLEFFLWQFLVGPLSAIILNGGFASLSVQWFKCDNSMEKSLNGFCRSVECSWDNVFVFRWYASMKNTLMYFSLNKFSY